MCHPIPQELLLKTKYTKTESDFGKAAKIVLFVGSKCHVRRSDGALVTVRTRTDVQIGIVDSIVDTYVMDSSIGRMSQQAMRKSKQEGCVSVVLFYSQYIQEMLK